MSFHAANFRRQKDAVLGYITKAEKQYAALAEKEEELNGKKGQHSSASKSRGKDKQP